MKLYLQKGISKDTYDNYQEGKIGELMIDDVSLVLHQSAKAKIIRISHNSYSE